MGREHYLAFDLGAESGRAVLGTIDDSGGTPTLTLAEKHRFANPTGRLNGHLYWNLLQQWEELKAGLRKTAAAKVELAGIGVDTWGVDFGLVGRGGEVLGNPFHYRDSRTDGAMERAFAKVSREEIFEQTGIQFMQLNTLYQLVALKQGGSPLLDCAETMLFMPDLFNFLFTGRRKSEFSIATTSQMYDPRQRGWAVGMLERLGLPTRILPTIVPSATTIGTVHDDVARECGCGPVPVIAPGCHDTASAVAAVPAEGSDWCYISSGTWSLMGVELDEPVIDAKSLRYNYTNEGGVGGKIRFLKNIMGLWLVQECRRALAANGHEHSYAELTGMAREARGLEALIDPDHPPFLSPGEMPAKIEQFCRQTNQSPPRTTGELVRTCLDSLALTYRRTLEGLEDVLGKKIGTIHIVGGGSQNELLNQMTADACARPVVAGPVEGTGIGNILAQALATGRVRSLPEMRRIVANSFEMKRYVPTDTYRWDQAYARFRELKRE